jgi:hypothetical protein
LVFRRKTSRTEIVVSLEEIVEDPSVIDEGKRWKRFGQFDHVRLYSREGFLKRIKEAGFLVNEYGKEFFGSELFSQIGISSQRKVTSSFTAKKRNLMPRSVLRVNYRRRSSLRNRVFRVKARNHGSSK